MDKRRPGIVPIISLPVLLITFLGLSSRGWSVPVDVANAPDSNLSLTLNAIQSAKQAIWMNIYELDAPEIQDAIIEQVSNGVEVQILEEGNPAGGFLKTEVSTRSAIIEAMNGSGANGNDHFFMMQKPTDGKTRRFRFDHAKYTIIDGAGLLIGSENYSPTGNPAAGKIGNRGWEAFVHDATLAAQFQSTFQADTSTSYGDVVDMVSGSSHLALGAGQWSDWIAGVLPMTRKPKKPVASGPDTGNSFVSLNADSVTSFTSPDTSEDGLISLITSAQSSLELELMTFTPTWGTPGKKSPLLTAVEKANTNVMVQVLLNNDKVFSDGAESPQSLTKTKTNPNLTTVNDLKKLKSQNVQAFIANIKAMGVDYIHNKGMLVDGNKVLVSSINWDETSVEHNREAAVVLQGTDVYNYFQALFSGDWQASTTK